MNEEELRDQIAGVAYKYMPSLSKANNLLRMVEQYAQQIEREAFENGYTFGVLHNEDNPNAHSQRNAAWDEYKGY